MISKDRETSDEELISQQEEQETGETSESDQKLINKIEGTRSQIAQLYVSGFLVAIGIALLIGYKKNFDLTGYKDLLLAISGVLSGPLGFIIGYYFKSSQDEK